VDYGGYIAPIWQENHIQTATQEPKKLGLWEDDVHAEIKEAMNKLGLEVEPVKRKPKYSIL
jgi:hypothetical protein